MNNVFDKVWLRVVIIVAVVTTAFTGTAWANEPITVELNGFTTTEGQIDGNISFSSTVGSIYENSLRSKTFTLTAANNAKINSVTLHWTTSQLTVRWTATNTSDTGTFFANAWPTNEPDPDVQYQQQHPQVSGLDCEQVVFSMIMESLDVLSFDYISVTYTPGNPDSGKTITALSNDTNYGTVELDGNVIIATPKPGYAVDDNSYTLTEGSAVVTQYGSNYFEVEPSPYCTIVINFVAHAGSVSLDFEHPLDHYTDWDCQGFKQVTSWNPEPHGGTYFGKTEDNVQTASIQTTAAIMFPGTFTCYICPMTTVETSPVSWKVQVSSDNSSWRDAGDALSYTTGWNDGQCPLNEWKEFSVDLSSETNVYVRICYYGEGKTAGIDDIVLTTRPASVNSTIPVSISSVGYSTLYYGTLNLVVPEGVTASTYSYADSKIEVSKTYVAGKVIPAGTGVVLQGGQGTYDFVITTEAGEEDANNALRGTDEAALTTDGGVFYALSTKNGSNVGFYWMRNDGAAFTNGAHKAYLALPSSGVKGFAFGLEDDATAIETIVDGQQTTEGAIYNLAGQRINKMQKGINIVNGKKILK